MIEKKYEIIDDITENKFIMSPSTKNGYITYDSELASHVLHRIRALKDFGNVKKGDIGGWIEKEANLSQEGDCWIYNNAAVYDEAMILGNAKVFNDAQIYGNSLIRDDARICDRVHIYNNPYICEKAAIYGDVIVHSSPLIQGNAVISDNSKIYQHAEVRDFAIIKEGAKVYGDAVISGNATLRGHCEVEDSKEYMTFDNLGSDNKNFTYTKSDNMWSECHFNGTSEEFIEQGYSESESDGDIHKYTVEYINNIYKLNKKAKSWIQILFQKK